MRDFEDEIRNLRERTESNRREFLRAELQTCSVAIERGRLELSLGDTHEARKELEVASRGAETIEKFMQQGAGRLTDLEPDLANLNASLAALRADLEAYPA